MGSCLDDLLGGNYGVVFECFTAWLPWGRLWMISTVVTMESCLDFLLSVYHWVVFVCFYTIRIF